ncbi:MAG: B12-binding domain-containing radical SAM protein, partial [Spirochaetes bacterium]|nr:B12-binding domain-containing radical SAM protein [Spirochaetota bacterium]
INPPIEDFYYTSIRRQPLGLLYIASSLLDAGHQIELINCHTNKKKVLPLPESLNYLGKYTHHSDPLLKLPFTKYTHFGMSFQEIEQRILKSNAYLFMISSMFTTYHEECETIINIIKKHKPDSYIAAGGYHASLYSDYFLNTLGIDFVLRGEGEISSVFLANAIQDHKDFRHIPGCSYKDERKIINNPQTFDTDINCFRFPARHLLTQKNFRFYRKFMTPILTSRGCPNSCSFCTGKIIWGNTYRTRSAGSIIEEIDYCIKNFNISCFNFEDDNLFATKERAFEILNALITYQYEKHIQLEFAAMNGTSIENLNPDIITLMHKAGFNEINISLVTHSTLIQKAENRPFSTDHFTEIINAAKKSGMNIRAYFILGLPSQTKQEISNTIGFLKSHKITFFPSVYYNVYSKPEEWKCQRSSAFFNETDYLTREDLIRFFNQCRI